MSDQERACANCGHGTGLNPHGAPTQDRLCNACDVAKRIEAELKTTRSRCSTALERLSYDIASRSGGEWPEGFDPEMVRASLLMAHRALNGYEAVIK